MDCLDLLAAGVRSWHWDPGDPQVDADPEETTGHRTAVSGDDKGDDKGTIGGGQGDDRGTTG